MQTEQNFLYTLTRVFTLRIQNVYQRWKSLVVAQKDSLSGIGLGLFLKSMLPNMLWPITVLTQQHCFLVICLEFKNLYLCQWRKHGLTEKSWWQARERGVLHSTEASAQLNVMPSLPKPHLSTGLLTQRRHRRPRIEGSGKNAEWSPWWMGDPVRTTLSKKQKAPGPKQLSSPLLCVS